MPVVTLTAFFADDDGHGWSEQHQVEGGSEPVSLTSILAAFDTLMKTKRRPLLGGDAFYLGCRASYKTTSGTIAASNILPDEPIRGQQTYAGQTVNMGPPEAAVKLRIQNAASTANSDVYIRGQWGALVVAGVLNLTTGIGAAWKNLSTMYFDAMRSAGYGWLGINPGLTSRGNVTNYAIQEGGTILFTVGVTNAVALPAVGTKMEIRFARINESNSVLNRSLLVVVRSATTLETVKNVAAGAFFSAGTYVAPVKGLIPYDHVGYYKLAKRACGRPFGVGRGRLPARPLV